jgi:hypothetical protein
MLSDAFELSFDYKDSPDFHPNKSYGLLVQKCKKAYEEISFYNNKVISSKIYFPWLEKYYSLFKSFNLPPINCIYPDVVCEFYYLCNDLEDLKLFLAENELAKIAIDEFEKVDITNENQLLSWLTKFEKSGKALVLFLYEINNESSEDTSFYEVENLKINASEFQTIVVFKQIFDKYYYDALEKYCVFTEDERVQFINEMNEMSNFTESLAYNLQKRGIVFD